MTIYWRLLGTPFGQYNFCSNTIAITDTYVFFTLTFDSLLNTYCRNLQYF